jgi:hypothetical protein
LIFFDGYADAASWLAAHHQLSWSVSQKERLDFFFLVAADGWRMINLVDPVASAIDFGAILRDFITKIIK